MKVEQLFFNVKAVNIVFDNIIYSKEKQGGISNYWYEITKGFSKDENVAFYEEKNSIENIFRKKLSITNTINHKDIPLILARLLPIKFTGSTESVLYHSSFYRKLISKAAVCEVTTVHDFLQVVHAPLLRRLMHNRLKYASIRRAK